MSVNNLIIIFLSILLGFFSVYGLVNQVVFLIKRAKLKQKYSDFFQQLVRIISIDCSYFKLKSFFVPDNFGRSPCEINKSIEIQVQLTHDQLFLKVR